MVQIHITQIKTIHYRNITHDNHAFFGGFVIVITHLFCFTQIKTIHYRHITHDNNAFFGGFVIVITYPFCV